MTSTPYTRLLLAPSDLVGRGALQLAALLAILDGRWALVPLLVLLGVTAVAPLLPRLSSFLPIVTHGPRRGDRVALTFDDGPGPATTPALL